MVIKDRKRFERLISEALAEGFSGWDFHYLAGRWVESPLSWDYPRIVREHILPEMSMLDMDTGGGEILSSLQPLPRNTYATEGYAPNVPVAKNRLGPLGVTVVQTQQEATLSFPDDFFDLVINRHGSFSAAEAYRVLKPGGWFITQQVGGRNNFELNEMLQEKPEFQYSYWTPDWVVKQLTDAGFQIVDRKEEFPNAVITDIGALVFHLKIISWQVAGFSVEKYRNKLIQIHNMMQETGSLTVKSHRFLVVAKKE